MKNPGQLFCKRILTGFVWLFPHDEIQVKHFFFFKSRILHRCYCILLTVSYQEAQEVHLFYYWLCLDKSFMKILLPIILHYKGTLPLSNKEYVRWYFETIRTSYFPIIFHPVVLTFIDNLSLKNKLLPWWFKNSGFLMISFLLYLLDAVFL